MIPWHQCNHPRGIWVENDFEMVPSLRTLSALVAVGSPPLSDSVVAEIPSELLPIMMSAAMKLRQIKWIQKLISCWRDATLSLSKLYPLEKGVSNWQRFSHREYLRHAHAVGIHYTTCFVHSFLSRSKSRDNYKLKLLDLRGYPTSDLTTSYLATHCLLHYNEVKKNQLVDLIQEAKDRQKITESDVEKFGDLDRIVTTLQETSYAVIMDCVIDSGQTFEKLCKALTVSNFADSPFCFIVNRLDMVNCIGDQVALALEILSPKYLTGLGISSNNLGNSQIREVFPDLHKFVNLTALDISSNHLDFSFDPELCDATAVVLANLPNLDRLDLSNNLVGPRLRRILTKCTKGLSYLNLSGCSLREIDIIYLANAQIHVDSLVELDLSHNPPFGAFTSDCLYSCLRAFGRSAQSPKGKGLRSLELHSCGLSESEKVLKTLEAVRSIGSLEYFNFAFNVIETGVALDIFPSLAGCQSLQAFCVSIPREGQNHAVADEFDFMYEDEESQNDILKRAAFKYDLLEQLIYKRREYLGVTNNLDSSQGVEVAEERDFLFFYTFAPVLKLTVQV